MRWAALLLTFALPGCGLGVATGADLVTIPVLGRSVGDIGASLVTGRDCSIVRLDENKTYCAAFFPDQRPQPFCTRTLGTVSCWESPALLPAPQTEVADTPPPTPDQVRYRDLPWPKSLRF